LRLFKSAFVKAQAASEKPLQEAEGLPVEDTPPSSIPDFLLEHKMNHKGWSDVDNVFGMWGD